MIKILSLDDILPVAVSFSGTSVTPYPVEIFDKIILLTGEYLNLIFESEIAIPDTFNVKF